MQIRECAGKKQLSGCCLRETDGFLHFFQEEEFLGPIFLFSGAGSLIASREDTCHRATFEPQWLSADCPKKALLDAWSLSVWQHHCLPRLWESQEDTESLNWIGFSVTKSHSTGEGRGLSSSTNVTFRWGIDTKLKIFLRMHIPIGLILLFARLGVSSWILSLENTLWNVNISVQIDVMVDFSGHTMHFLDHCGWFQ